MSKYIYKTTRRIRNFGYPFSRNFLNWIYSFPLLNIYKKGRRIRGFSSLLSNSFFKIFFYLLNIPKYIYKRAKRLRKHAYPICSWKSFPLQNIPNYIYKGTKRLRKFDSPLPHLFLKYPLLNIPKCIYKRVRKLRKFDSPLLNLFFKIFSFANYSQVRLQKS